MKARMIAHLTVITVAFTMSFNAQDMFKATRLTFDPAQEGFPSWSPDGKPLAFTSTRSGNFNIWLMDLDIEQLKKELQIADR